MKSVKTKGKAGFTLTEIMIVVAIIALLAIMVLPSFANSRTRSQRTCCINNLRQISGAKDQYALDKMNAVPLVVTEFVPSYLPRIPRCPNAGTYTIRRLGRDPRCTLGLSDGHTI